MSELKYEWGVEYECNGVRPDLPDDVLVVVDGVSEDQWLAKRKVKANLWGLTKRFRVVDDRYKPVGFVEHAVNDEAKKIQKEITSMLPGETIVPPSKPNKYHRQIIGMCGQRVTVDVYRVLHAFPTGLPEIDHAVKKLLAPSMRGAKDWITDLREAAQSIECAIKYLEQTTDE